MSTFKITTSSIFNVLWLSVIIMLSFASSATAQVCGTSGLDGPSVAVNPINTYYPISGNTTLNAGGTSISLSPVPPTDAYGNNYGNIAVRAGDLILIIQMQDATINSSNTNLYGSGLLNSVVDLLGGAGYMNLGNSGKYEYVIATNDVPITGGTLNFRGGNANGGTINTYVNANATATRGQRRFQVVRVPQFSTLTLTADVTTVPYNGAAGGVIAFDVAGVMNFNGFKIDASQKGFRGGYGPNGQTGNNVANVYAILSNNTASVGKGESVAGTPRYMYDGYKDVDNVIEGLPGGSFGKGAPANGGGGGNDHNAGGGGGGNGGSGGVGGLGWAGGGTLTSIVNGILNYPNGGRPGSAIPANPSILILGGGGGGGDANNAMSGVKGGVGGGIVIVNVEAISGNGLIQANGGVGQAGVYGGAPDGAGGGGAGGSVFLRALKNSPGANITIEARGGNGGNTERDRNDEHGPGGGGGGGVVHYRVPGATISTNILKGNSGKTNSGLDNQHGATDGSNGAAASFTDAQLPPYLQGGGSICYPQLNTTVAESAPGINGIRNAGTTAVYTITVDNLIGGGNAGDVKTQFTLPAGFNFSSVSASTTGNASGPANPNVTQSGSTVTFGSYNISPGDQVVFTVVVNIDNNVQPGLYHASAQSDYLDPTRTIANPNRRITAKTNAFAGSHTNYETGGMGDVLGTSYNGLAPASIQEDVYINSAPVAQSLTISTIECERAISGTLTASDPDANHPLSALTFALEGSYDTSKGTFAIDNQGRFTFTPSVRLFGSIEINFRVTDPLGLYDVEKLTINQPKALLDLTEQVVQVTCYNGANGSINASGSGGVGTISYLWEYPNGATATTNLINNLKAGTYKLTITDANNCTYSETYTINQPNELTVSATHTVITCVGGNATLTLSASGATAPYQYTVNGITNSNGVFNNLTAGIYTYTVGDANSCSPTTGSINIVGPSVNLTSGSASQTVCVNTPIVPVTLAVSNSVNPITVSGLPSGVTANITSNAITLSGTPTVSGSFPFAVNVTGCSAPVLTGNILVNIDAMLTQVTNVANQTICVNTAIDPISYEFGGSATAATVTGLPSGITAMLSGNRITIEGQTALYGNFPFSVTTVGPCVNPVLTGSLNVLQAPTMPDAGADQQVCSGTAVVLTGNQPTIGTGVWSKVGNFPGTIANANTRTTTVTGLAPGKYNFVWTISNGVCPNSDLIEITVLTGLANNSITGDQTIFAHEIPQAISGTIPTGADGNYTYEWQSSASTDPNSFVTIVGASSANYQSGQLNGTTYFRRIAKSACGDLVSNLVRINIIPSADLVTVKSTTATVYVPGETVTYTIRVKNNGPSDAANVTVTDIAPAGTTMASWSARAVSGTIAFPSSNGTGNLSQQIAVFPNGAEAEYTVVLNIPANFNAGLSNAVSTSSTTTDPNTSCINCITPQIPADPKADIVTAKSTTATVYVPGETVTYTIRVKNNGPSDAASVTVSDIAPTGTTMTSWSARAVSGTIAFPSTIGTGNLSQQIAVFPNGAEAEYIVILSIPANFNAGLRNAVSTTSTTTDPDPSCINCITPQIPADPKADIVTAKSTTATIYVPGETVTYTIRVKNNGPSDAASVTVTDIAPTGTTIDSWSARTVSGTIAFPSTNGTGDLSQQIAVFPNGAEAEYTVVLKIPANFNSRLSNAVSTSSTTTDPDPSCINCTTPLIPSDPKADIVTAKSTTATVYVPGETITYTIRVKNNGPSDAASVTVTDIAPTGTSMASWRARAVSGTIAFPSTSGTGNLSQQIAVFPNGAEAEYTVVLNIPSNFNGGLSNAVTITSITSDPDPSCVNCVTPEIPADPKADIVAAKSTTATIYVPGETVAYTIRVKNNGPSDATNVTVTDIAPTGTTMASWTARAISGTVVLPNTIGTGDLSQQIAVFPNGAEVEYIVVLNIPANFNAGLSNAVSTSSTTTDPDPDCNTCITPSIPANPKADIVIAKSTTATVYVPGETVTYTIRVKNNGPSDAASVTVTDIAPTGTTIASWSARAVSGTIAFPSTNGTGDLSQQIAIFPNGAEAEYTVVLHIPANFNARLSNAVSTSSTTTDPDPSCTNCVTPLIPADPKADMVTVKSTTATVYVPGETVTYTIRVKNNGPSDAASVTVTDIAPTGTTMASWSARAVSGTIVFPSTNGTGNLSQQIAVFPNGAEAEYTVVLNIPANFNARLSNAVSTSSTTADPDPSCDNCITPLIPADPKADIVATKSTTATVYVPGETVTYTIRVKNNGPSDAANVKVTDIAPTGTTIASWSARAVSGTLNFPSTNGVGNLEQTIAVFSNGAEAEYTVVLKILASFNAGLSNAVSTTSTTTDPDPSCINCITPQIPADPKADIVAAKSTTATVYVPGETVTYTIRVKNNGPSDATNVTVTDIAPSGTTMASWSARAVSGTIAFPSTNGTGDLSQQIAVFPNGAEAEYTVVLNIPSNFNAGLSNAVSTSSTTTDPDPSCTNCVTPLIPANPKADIVTAKSTTATVYVPGETVTYTIRVKNNGPSDAANVKVTDIAPAGTTMASWSVRAASGTIAFPSANGTGNLEQTIAVFPNGAEAEYTVVLNIPTNFNAGLSNAVSTTSTTADPDPSCTNCVTPLIPANPKADIVAAKSTTATVYVPGETVTYTIRVKNNGPSDAANVKVTDIAPAGTRIALWSARAISGTLNFPSTNGTGNLEQTIAVFPNGAEAEYLVVLQIPANFNIGLSNAVSTTSTTADPDSSCINCITPQIPADSKADIIAAKSTTATVYVPGETVSYTIRVKNNGPSDATNVKVTDIAPVGTTMASWNVRAVNGTILFPSGNGLGNLEQTIPVFPNGAEAEYTVVLKIPANFKQPLSNVVSTTSTTTDPDPSCANCVTPPIAGKAITDLEVRKSNTQQSYIPGGLVKYIISIKNHGPSDAENVKVTDIAPSQTVIETWEASAASGTVNFARTQGNGNLEETIPLIANGAEAIYTVYVRVPRNYTGTVTNQVTINNPSTDPTPACDECVTPPVPIEDPADLYVTKTLKNPAQTTYRPGDDVVYLITITNKGPGPSRNVRVLDMNPIGTTITSWKATVANGSVSLPAASGRGKLDQTIALFPSAATVVYEVVMKTSPSQTSTIVNIANVQGETFDPTPDPNLDPECPNCVISPPVSPLIEVDLSIVKTAEMKDLTIGTDFEYKLQVKNRSLFDATNVVVTDMLPPEVEYTPSADSQIEYEAKQRLITWRLGRLAANQSAQLTFKTKVKALGKISNTAKVAALEPDPDLSNNSSTAIKQSVVLNVPNVVTPNGDGKNDTFKIEGIGLYKNSSLSIFNRWGNEVYRSNGPYKNDWDGSGLNEGTYFYLLKIDAEDGQTKTQTGYITLLRD